MIDKIMQHDDKSTLFIFVYAQDDDNQFYACCRLFLGNFDYSRLTKLEICTTGFTRPDDSLIASG